jgi:hypothetical protein
MITDTSKLAKYELETKDITATISKKIVNSNKSKDVVLLIDISIDDLLIDHMWVSLSKRIDKFDINDTIQFSAKILSYTKYSTMENKYKLSHLRNISLPT